MDRLGSRWHTSCTYLLVGYVRHLVVNTQKVLTTLNGFTRTDLRQTCTKFYGKNLALFAANPGLAPFLLIIFNRRQLQSLWKVDDGRFGWRSTATLIGWLLPQASQGTSTSPLIVVCAFLASLTLFCSSTFKKSWKDGMDEDGVFWLTRLVLTDLTWLASTDLPWLASTP